jgi:hypothetical protein
MNQQPLYIKFSNIGLTCELKYGLIHLLLVFHSFASEDPHKHFKKFYVVCSTINPYRVTKGQIKLRAFLFSLTDKANDLLYYLLSRSITTWNNLKIKFLKKFFSTLKAGTIWKEISEIFKNNGKTLYEYWELFD